MVSTVMPLTWYCPPRAWLVTRAVLSRCGTRQRDPRPHQREKRQYLSERVRVTLFYRRENQEIGKDRRSRPRVYPGIIFVTSALQPTALHSDDPAVSPVPMSRNWRT